MHCLSNASLIVRIAADFLIDGAALVTDILSVLKKAPSMQATARLGDFQAHLCSKKSHVLQLMFQLMIAIFKQET